jgi:archaeal cell division control protein 6
MLQHSKLYIPLFHVELVMERGLKGFFETFLSKESMFREKAVLQSNYAPDAILHRDEQIRTIAHILAPALKSEKPSNIFLYGKTGTGKTTVAKYVADQMANVAKDKEKPLRIIYLNCKLKRIADTEYRLVAQLVHEYGAQVPSTGLPTDDIYSIFINLLEREGHNLILVLDEIDQLVKKAGDGIIYNLTRLNSDLKKVHISIVGISNDLMFIDNIDPRVKSSLSEEEIVFPPYNALQLQDILRRRAKRAFKEEVLTQGVIEKCAAYAAREHGDARRALELLRVAAEIAEREESRSVLIDHIDKAEEKIERDRIQDVVRSQPKQQQLTLYSILQLCTKQKGVFYTGEVYELYKTLCEQSGVRPLTQRRLSDIIGELDMLGIINAHVISKGRFGRTREISAPLVNPTLGHVKKILEQSLGL